MKNAYADLGKVVEHCGYGFDDVIVENVYTTDMAKFAQTPVRPRRAARP